MCRESHGFVLDERCLVTVQGVQQPGRISEFMQLPSDPNVPQPVLVDCAEVVSDDSMAIVPIDDQHLRHLNKPAQAA
jgi:hypothetical protein